MNKTKLSTLLIGLLSLSALVGCNPSVDPTTSNNGSSTSPTSQGSTEPAQILIKAVDINKQEADVMLGSTLKLEATYTPTNATETELVWASDDETVATVDQTGLVSAVGGGNTRIMASIGDIKAECLVTVTVPIISMPGWV